MRIGDKEFSRQIGRMPGSGRGGEPASGKTQDMRRLFGNAVIGVTVEREFAQQIVFHGGPFMLKY